MTPVSVIAERDVIADAEEEKQPATRKDEKKDGLKVQLHEKRSAVCGLRSAVCGLRPGRHGQDATRSQVRFSHDDGAGGHAGSSTLSTSSRAPSPTGIGASLLAKELGIAVTPLRAQVRSPTVTGAALGRNGRANVRA